MIFLTELTHNKSYLRIKDKTTKQIKESFFANYVTGLLFIRLGDLRTLKLLNDSKHEKINKISDKISDINYWAACVFGSKKDKNFKHIVGERNYHMLMNDVSGIMHDRIEEMLESLYKPSDMINWNRIIPITSLIAKKLDVRSSLMNKTLSILENWDDINDNEKSIAISKCFQFLIQVEDKDSKLLERLRVLSNKFILNTGKAKIVGVSRINEDDIISAANIGSFSSMLGDTVLNRLNLTKPKEKDQIVDVKSGNTAFRKLGGKIIKKKKQNFKVIKFKNSSLESK